MGMRCVNELTAQRLAHDVLRRGSDDAAAIWRGVIFGGGKRVS